MPVMARSYDIAEFNLSDGLTPRQVDKLNSNFRRLISMLVSEDAGLTHAVSDMDFPLAVGDGGTGSVSFPANALLIGNTTRPIAYLSTSHGFLYADGNGQPAYWRMIEAGDSNWFGAGTPTGDRDPFSEATDNEKAEHLGDLYFNTSPQQGDPSLYYYANTGTDQSPIYQWVPLSVVAAGSMDYDAAINKPTITEQDLGIIGSGDNRTFGPTGTSTTVTIEGDKSQAGYQDQPFTTTEIDVIIAMAERAGAI